MNPILQQLYYGSLCPQGAVEKTPPAYEIIQQQQARFRSLLQERAPELTVKFDVLADDIQTLFVDETEDMFGYGFGLAVKLLAEGLSYQPLS